MSKGFVKTLSFYEIFHSDMYFDVIVGWGSSDDSSRESTQNNTAWRGRHLWPVIEKSQCQGCKAKVSDISQYHIHYMNSNLLWPVLQFNNFYYNSVLPPSGITDWIIVCCRLTLTNRQKPFTTLSGAVIKCQGHGLRLMER